MSQFNVIAVIYTLSSLSTKVFLLSSPVTKRKLFSSSFFPFPDTLIIFIAKLVNFKKIKRK